MSTAKINAVKGMEDLFDPEQAKAWHWVEATARGLFERDGFQEIRTPILEDIALFERGVGESTEIVEKEMYTLKDRNDKTLALRPEGTAPVVRAFIEHFTSHNVSEGRFYYLGPMFRYEKPQAGRLRQFHQIGAEIFGSDHPLTDAELIGSVSRLFSALGVKNVELQINSLGSREVRESYKKTLTEFLQSIAAKLCADCQRRIAKNPLRALDCKKEACIAATAAAPRLIDALDAESRSQFDVLQAGLQAQGVSFQVNPRLVRGLDYYEKTVFEFVSSALGAQNAVAAGGRYNGLVRDLGGPAVPAVGFALGMERLVSLVDFARIPSQKSPKLYLLPLGEAAERELFQQMVPLRETGARVEIGLGAGSLKSKMRRADRFGAEWVVLLGEGEREKGVVVIRDMRNSTQEEIKFVELFKTFTARFSRVM